MYFNHIGLEYFVTCPESKTLYRINKLWLDLHPLLHNNQCKMLQGSIYYIKTKDIILIACWV